LIDIFDSIGWGSHMGKTFDPFNGLGKDLNILSRWLGWSYRAGRSIRARKARRQVEQLYGPEVADAVEAAVRSGRSPDPIIERARRDLADQQERQRQLTDPPPLYGSARWPTSADLQPYLRPKDAFDDPRSIMLGAFCDEGQTKTAGYVHWDGDGHLLTIAPTRSGKALTTIIPNLLRYKGSCVVLDPKGELFDATSKWRGGLGPVYRIAPFSTDSTKPSHRFDPVSQIRSEADARAIAQQMFPPDPKASSFFADDAEGFLTAVILYVRHNAPPNRRNLTTVSQMAALKGASLLQAVQKMAAYPPTAAAARALMDKDPQRGLKVLQDTLTSKINRWLDAEIQASTAGNDVDFRSLKDQIATVYIEIPFPMMKTYAGWLRVVLKAALDAMITNPKIPDIPVLFVLDEFLNIGPFPEYRDAIRTHAGAGVRLWFFLQDIYSIEEHYPGNSWRPFLNCAVKQFFGVNDHDTASMIGSYLGHKTHAIRTTGGSTNVSSHLSSWYDTASTITGFSMTEGVQFLGRPLMTPDEIRELLGGWAADGSRHGIIDIAGTRPFRAQLVVHTKSATCTERVGTLSSGDNNDRTGSTVGMA